METIEESSLTLEDLMDMIVNHPMYNNSHKDFLAVGLKRVGDSMMSNGTDDQTGALNSLHAFLSSLFADQEVMRTKFTEGFEGEF